MDYLNQLWNDYSGSVLGFGIALLYLIGFYIAAKIVKALIRKALHRTEIDNRFTQAVGLKEAFPIESVVAGFAYWIILIFGFVTFLEKLNLEIVAQPVNTLLTVIFAYLPKIGAAIGLLVLAWVLASLVKMVVQKGAGLFQIDQRLNSLDEDASKQMTVGDSLATAGYWLVFLLFLPMVLGALEMQSLVSPLQNMFSKLFTYLPNLLSAALIFIIGNFVARVVRQILTSLLAAAGADHLSEKVGLSQPLSALVGTLAFTFILLLVIVQSLDALQVAAISAPAQRMIDMIFSAVPGIISAVLVLGISYYVGKLLAGLVSDLLAAAGFNGITDKLGITVSMQRTPSEYVGSIILFAVILFAVLGATELLGFAPLSNIVTNMIHFTVQVVLGAIILAIGVALGNKVNQLICESGAAAVTGSLARIAILVLATAMALRQVGLAEDIINLAFGILLGALAVAAAIAIGFGSKEIAGREVELLIDRMRK